MSALHYAAYGGHRDLVEMLLDRGVDVNIKKDNNSTPLHGAALDGDLDVMTLLISRGADIDVRNQAGYTPLLSAVAGSQLEAVELLLTHGADANATLERGGTALMESIPHDGENIELARLLIGRGADVNAVTEYGVTALMRASWWGKTETARLLIAHGADVNFKTKDRPPAIVNAARGGHLDFVSLLIANGAKLNVKDNQSATPLILAAIHGHEDVVGALLANGANVSHREKNYGRTALHCAAIKGDQGVAEALIEGGASINRKDNAGKTALNYAAQYAHKDVADLLVSHEAVAYNNYEENYGVNRALHRQVQNGEAQMWYLGHCGWAIKTQNHVLIFDYWNRGVNPANPCLANGHIDPEEIADHNVYVFVTHEHGDHYDTTIFDWAEKVKDITYIYGFRPEIQPIHRETGYHGPEYVYAGPHENINIDGMDITTIQANDAGVGFLIKVDGVTLFHAGDHAGWAEGQREGFTREIDYLNERVDEVDLAFVNITGCHAHGPEQLWEGNCYTINWLNPGVVVPTHAIDREYLYKEFADRVKREDLDVKVYCPENRGDKYHYKGKASS
jgi:ankyrin repeat protein/L-ascorbate metabolism protein UlaG (beta-lactamase superfamily)